MSSFKLRKTYAAVLAATCAAFPVASSAQSMMEEIVVTAAKRAQTLQEVPIAVSVTSSETIEKAAIQDINDLQSIVPTLRVTQLQSSANTSFSIRGFGNGTNNQGIEPSVGIFIDGVYRSRAGAAISDLPRLERVEVLSGPQSTLFGKNASAGVISVVTPKPSGETGGFVAAGLSNFNGRKVSGLFESAVSDDLSFDISANVSLRDGYFDNSFNGTEQNERDRWGLRGQVYFTPTDASSIRIIADYDEIDEVCCGTTNLVSGPTEAAVRAVGGNLVPNAPFSRNSFLDVEPYNTIENGGVSAHIDVDFESFTLTSISSYRFSDGAKNIDIDYTSAELASSGKQDLSLKVMTQEFRLTSTTDGDVEWMVGGFFFDEELDFTDEVIWGEASRGFFDGLAIGAGAPAGVLAVGEAALGFAPGEVFFAPGTGAMETMTQENQAVSFFGQVDWHLSDALTATVGFNYTTDEKDVSVKQDHTNVFAQLPAALVGPLAALQVLPPIVDFPNSVEPGTTDDEDLTYTFRLAYDVNESVNVYGSIGTGFKASSWNLSRDTVPNINDFAALQAAGLTANTPNLTFGQRFAGPEEAEVIELGLKASFERGSLNVAIFDQTINGFQSAIFNGVGFDLLNAGEQSTKGVEFDLTYYPVDALQLNLGGIFLDPIYDSFVLGSNENGTADLSGQTPAGIHEVSMSASATYEFDLAGHSAFVRGDYQYESDVRVVDNILASIASREVKLLNLSAGLSTDSGYDFTAWVRNITDEDYLLSAFPTPTQSGSFNGYPNTPRTFGVDVKKTF